MEDDMITQGLSEKEELVAEESVIDEVDETDDQGGDPLDDWQNDDHLESFDDTNLGPNY